MTTEAVSTGRFALVLFGAIVFGALGLLWLNDAGPSRAPDIAVTTLQGEKLNFARLQGRPVLVNFWATSCRGCLEELPHLIALYKELAPRGLEIVGIAMPYDRPDRVVAVSEAKQIPYPIALDVQGAAASAFGDVQLTPTTFLLAPDGRVLRRDVGDLEVDKMRALIRGLLAQTEPAPRRLAGN